MRDALSVLDQVLSFGTGPVTADRVRAVLGLIPDELYGEMLRLVSERDAAAVFPLVERLLEAGADLGEFVDGAGETLRALLVAGLGGQPEGLTEGLAQVVRSAAARLPLPTSCGCWVCWARWRCRSAAAAACASRLSCCCCGGR